MKKFRFVLIILAVLLIASATNGGKKSSNNADQTPEATTETSVTVAPEPTATAAETEQPTSEPTPTATVEVTEEPTPEPTSEPTEAHVYIDIDGVTEGEYGREITLNANTDMPVTYIGYFVPEGRYMATNLDDDGGNQLSFYLDETQIVGEWEEAKSMPDHRPVVLMAGDSSEIVVYDGEYIKISEGHIQLEPLD